MIKDMVRIKLVLIVAVLSWFMPETIHAGLYNPKMFKLDNGLQVVVLENHRANVVTHSVWYKVGAADDPWSKSGLAHFLEHLMFKGPDDSASARYQQHLSRIGGAFNAMTGSDTTNYYATVASEQLESVVALEAGRMANLSIIDEQAKNELKVIVQERKMRLDNDSISRFSEILNAKFTYNHPYRLPIIGWEHEILQLTAEDARAFYQQWYAPNNAYVIFAGDITVEQARRLATRYYGSIPAKILPERKRLQEPPHRNTREFVTLNAEEVAKPFLLRYYQSPNFKSDNGKHQFPIQVLQYILINNSWGLLYKHLVEHLKIATFIDVEQSIYSLDPSNVVLVAQPVDGEGLKKLEIAMDLKIAEIINTGITADDLTRAKKQMTAGTLFAKDGIAAGASGIGYGLSVGVKIEDIDNWVEAIQMVTLDQVVDTARSIFGQHHHLTAHLLPQLPPTQAPCVNVK